MRGRIVATASFVLIFGLFLLQLQRTDADLNDESRVKANTFKATTLALSVLNGANNKPLTYVFNEGGFVPGGLEAKVVRVKNTGKMATKFYIRSKIIEGEAEVCDSLGVRVMSKEVQGSEVRLVGLNYESPTLNSGEKDDLVLLLSLPEKEELKAKTCSFEIKVSTQAETPKVGFFDNKEIPNNISS